MASERPSAAWMDEQAAEYQDLVGSFVESVHDEETDEMIEYQLIWEGGDLGVALTPMDNESVGVMVSRVTGKGFPFGIKNVGPGDILLSINLRDTTKMTLDQVVAFLQECDLPATLRFKKMSPDLDPTPPVVRRMSNIIVTTDGPTSPMGSQAPPLAAQRSSTASSRMSQKSVFSQQSQSQRNTMRFSTASSARMSMQHGRMSVSSRPSEMGPRASEMSHGVRPSDPVQSPPLAPMPAPPQPKQVSPKPKASPAKSPVVQAPRSPVPENVRQSSERAPPPPPPQPKATPAPAPAPVVVPVSQPQPAPAKKTPRAAAAAPVAPPVVTERYSSESYQSSADRESWKSSEEDIDEARERVADLKLAAHHASLARGESIEDEQVPRGKAQSVAMLGDYSTQTSGIPILPEESIMGVITSVDGVPQAEDFVESDEDVSPLGHAVQPAAVAGRSSRHVGPPSPVQQLDLPRDSVRMTMDGGAEPMMKAQPIGALHELCAKGNLRSVMQHLQVNGPDGLIQREANHGQTCLHLAVKSGNLQLVKHLLEQYQPADELINVEDDKGNTALHFAATKTPGMVHMLLETGASANVKNARKLTPLIISVITSKDDAIIIPRMLLKFGANPNDMHDSHTVIHTAIGSGLLNIAGALVHAGAKMDVEDVEGKSVFEKLDKKSLRFLISHIYFPPTFIGEKERADCMLCHKKFKFGHRKNNCTHCGRLCCSECSSLNVEMYKFPMGFPGRIRKGAAVRDLKRVCKTCFGVFKERGDTPQKEESRFMNRVIGVEWDEVNPNKLQSYQSAGRRGEKY